MEAWYSSIPENQIGRNLLKTVTIVDDVECGVRCLAECKSYRTEKVSYGTVTTYILYRNSTNTPLIPTSTCRATVEQPSSKSAEQPLLGHCLASARWD